MSFFCEILWSTGRSKVQKLLWQVSARLANILYTSSEPGHAWEFFHFKQITCRWVLKRFSGTRESFDTKYLVAWRKTQKIYAGSLDEIGSKFMFYLQSHHILILFVLHNLKEHSKIFAQTSFVRNLYVEMIRGEGLII